jgi:hypothetical protein
MLGVRRPGVTLVLQDLERLPVDPSKITMRGPAGVCSAYGPGAEMKPLLGCLNRCRANHYGMGAFRIIN